MIDWLWFGIGFLIYVLFNIVTFEVYSQKKEMTKFFVLIFIYIYYSILAVYLINLVDSEAIFFEKLVQSAIYLVTCAIILSHYYNSNIKTQDEQLYGN